MLVLEREREGRGKREREGGIEKGSEKKKKKKREREREGGKGGNIMIQVHSGKEFDKQTLLEGTHLHVALPQCEHTLVFGCTLSCFWQL